MEKLTDEQRDNMNRLLTNIDVISVIQKLLEENGVTDIVVKSINLRPKILNPIVTFESNVVDNNAAHNRCRPGYELKPVCDGNVCRLKCVRIPT